MSFEKERGVYVGTPYVLIYVGFAIVLLLDLVLKQGRIDLTAGAEITVLIFGILGLMTGYIVNVKYLRTGRPAPKDRQNVWKYGFMMFIGVTLFDAVFMQGWIAYAQSVQDIGQVLVLAAAPFEEALFRLTIASVLYRGMNPLIEESGFPASRIGKTKITSLDLATMIGTSIITSWLFAIYHVGVYGSESALIMNILFLNSFIYTMVYLYTGDIMTSTTAHLLHNASVIFMV